MKWRAVKPDSAGACRKQDGTEVWSARCAGAGIAGPSIHDGFWRRGVAQRVHREVPDEAGILVAGRLHDLKHADVLTGSTGTRFGCQFKDLRHC